MAGLATFVSLQTLWISLATHFLLEYSYLFKLLLLLTMTLTLSDASYSLQTQSKQFRLNILLSFSGSRMMRLD